MFGKFKWSRTSFQKSLRGCSKLDIPLVGSSHKVLATENKLDMAETGLVETKAVLIETKAVLIETKAVLIVYDAILNSLDKKEQNEVNRKVRENWK